MRESILKYRPEIDGLRALAIIPVVLFHFGIAGFDGGFVGVDIFFVISGFLISAIIIPDVEAGQFSFVNFYERRARRILPALFVVVAAAFFFAWFFYMPSDFKKLGASAAALSAFASNIYFWCTIWYFSNLDNYLLLQTWSLAVEEQFYLFYPIVLVLVVKFNPFKNSKKFDILFWSIILGVLVSFVLNIVSLRAGMVGAPFYLLPARAWELLLGALLFYVLRHKHLSDLPLPPLKKITQEILSVSGALMIAIAIFAFDKTTPFPGYAALLPTLGAVLIIYSTSEQLTLVGRVLAWKPLVWIGLISYPLYLWHWTIFSATNYLLAGMAFSAQLSSLLIALSVLLAWLSWRYIETPIRKRKILKTTKRIFVFSGVGLLMIMFMGIFVYVKEGVPNRLDKELLQAYNEAISDLWDRQDDCVDKYEKSDTFKETYNTACYLNLSDAKLDSAIDFIVLGDSHAYALAPLYERLTEEHALQGKIFSETRDNLKPKWYPNVYHIVKYYNIPNVITAEYWTRYSEDIFQSRLERIEEMLLYGVNVYVVLDVPAQNFDVPKCILTNEWFGKCPANVSLDEHLARQRSVNSVFSALAKEYDNLYLIDPTDYLCDSGYCLAQKDGNLLYFDDDHLSTHGALYLEPVFAPYFKQIAQASAQMIE